MYSIFLREHLEVSYMLGPILSLVGFHIRDTVLPVLSAYYTAGNVSWEVRIVQAIEIAIGNTLPHMKIAHGESKC